jgi:integrin beta 1
LYQLGGIIKANDGKCHLDENRVYSKGIQLDYPSIAQVRDRIKESFVFVVFAVTKGQLGIYTELAKAIGTESASAQSIDDQKSIAEVIESEYKVCHKQACRISQMNEKKIQQD